MADEDMKSPAMDYGVNKFVAATMVLSLSTGTGFVLLPRAMSEIGWLTIPLLLIFGLLALYGGNRLAECWFILEERWPEYKGPTRKPYLEIGYRAFGNKGKYAVLLVYNSTLVGSSLVSFIMISQFITNIFASLSFCQVVFLLGVAITPLSWLEAPKNFWQITATAVTVTIIGAYLVTADLYLHRDLYPVPSYGEFKITEVIFGISRVLYTIGIGSGCPMIQNEMRHKSKFNSSIILAIIALMIETIPLIMVSYLVLGENIPVNMLLYKKDQNSIMYKAINVFLMIDWISILLLCLSPLCMQYEELLHIPRKFCWKRAVFRTFVVMLMVTVVLLFPSLSHIVSILGGFTVAFLSFIFPSVFYWKLHTDSNKNSNEALRSASIFDKILLLTLLVLGVVSCLVITSTTLENITKFKFSESCLFSLVTPEKSTSISGNRSVTEYNLNGDYSNISEIFT